MVLGFKRKVAVFIGGNSGIGRATAKLLADEGVKVALLNKTTNQLKAALADGQTMGKAMAVQADLSGWGQVVLVASEDALQPYTDGMPNFAAQAGVLNFAKNLSKAYAKEAYAKEACAKDRVLVNLVAPAFVATPTTDAMVAQRAEKIGTVREGAIASFLTEERLHRELQRRGKAEEVAAVNAFLCSQQSSIVVGANCRVNGRSVADVGL